MLGDWLKCQSIQRMPAVEQFGCVLVSDSACTRSKVLGIWMSGSYPEAEDIEWPPLTNSLIGQNHVQRGVNAASAAIRSSSVELPMQTGIFSSFTAVCQLLTSCPTHRPEQNSCGGLAGTLFQV